jgi:hypothetical protein
MIIFSEMSRSMIWYTTCLKSLINLSKDNTQWSEVSSESSWTSHLHSCLVFLFVVNLCHSEDFQDRILGTMVGFLIWSVIVHGFDSRSNKKKHYKIGIFSFLATEVVVCYLCGESGHSGNKCSNPICYNCNLMWHLIVLVPEDHGI